MLVGMDVTPVMNGTTGVARYARELPRALVARHVDVRQFAVGNAEYAPPPEVRHLRIPRRVLLPAWRWLGWPRAETMAGAVDVVHVLDRTAPPTRRPLVMTLHDLSTTERADLHPPWAVAQQRRQVESLKKADIVVTVSRATADALIRLGGDPGRIVVTHLGVTPLEAGDPVNPMDDTFLLAVGELIPRKGYDVLLRAYAAAAPEPRLALAGPEGWRSEELHDLARSLGIADRVDFLGRVEDQRLATLYRHALALCFPSRAEGFGLPVLEALSVGLPVVASRIDAVCEVAGDAALYVPVDDPQALAAALTTVTTDATCRAELAAGGRQRAAQFTWANTANETLEAYERAAACA
jgi:glycosyltransferase involved in cell wall biosynthesis